MFICLAYIFLTSKCFCYFFCCVIFSFSFGARIALSDTHEILVYLVRKFGKTLKMNSFSVFTACPKGKQFLPFSSL